MKSRLKLISCAVTVYFGVLLSSILHNLICVLRIDHIVSELKEEKQFFKMGKFVVMLVMEFFVIMPIVFGRYHGRYDSYKQYYDQINSGGPKYPTTTYKMSKESFYDVKENMKPQFEDNSKNKIKGIFEFSDEWQPRNGGDNYASVPRCEKQTFCEDVPNYPQAYVNQELAKNSSLLQYAYQDVIAVSPRLDNEDIPLCLSTERLILPKTAVNMQDQWMYIVQGDDNFRQSLRIEACNCQTFNDIDYQSVRRIGSGTIGILANQLEMITLKHGKTESPKNHKVESTN
ncbi:uncharacterized protein LOC105207756 isoform X2 [Solenopsis invicta]|uniref:uncharacterized protein LOC105207756 isoform X2 n=1 Tax=Solenopsis invicta TaxID=13686 RepID=UPI000595DAA0|nr:uncharacterized protein LOC105207756 isoform X2 [Solenopsis invicta]XP_039313435.1 uncharacterized protein LOC105207756 isoform X2 [Solenopsis invicta]